MASHVTSYKREVHRYDLSLVDITSNATLAFPIIPMGFWRVGLCIVHSGGTGAGLLAATLTDDTGTATSPLSIQSGSGEVPTTFVSLLHTAVFTCADIYLASSPGVPSTGLDDQKIQITINVGAGSQIIHKVYAIVSRL